ncbi:methylenetetrahydrofolate dehydrogenase (NADP+) / methenyltetrahydrofolate cyclohydrolase [Desulfacinum hydrothermale DSM 13146]|uniref:Bifunctional protein FolD n=2 Tax=Desulfacinum hydrothermale TaxID=109258 RepID=A0A1W1XI68_9BACT|nr:methylenetetrahydrofolate dehydrogenase (NADP+) / methenyltetrahydrofolate cyclohydrolase [Desulfacinum hydrothermale DSM 13146]
MDGGDMPPRRFFCRKGEEIMSAKLIKGAEVAKEIRAELKEEVQRIKEKYGVEPGLVTILVGENPASQSYVRAKQKAAHDLGFYSVQDNQPADISEEALLALIDKYNKDPKIDGILIQLPLPKHINENKVLYAIDPGKDVDAFHPFNVGKLMIGQPDYLPCTPAGIQELLIRSGTETSGAEVVVVGRSNIVGKPIAVMMMQKGPGANATVTVCHTRTKDVQFHTKRADILIVAAGVTEYVKGDWIKPGAVVIDVGVNEVGRTADGKRILKGDVAFDEAKEVASAITPVPGGVGPMTITMLMKNTVRACKVHNNIKE